MFLVIRAMRREAIVRAIDAQVRSQNFLVQILAGIETLKACDQTELEAGEAVIVTTPTPGGFGR